ncbi:MAG: response regulator [Granulosicoccus sp.]
MENIRVIVVDDHPLFRQGVVQVLNNESHTDVVGEGSCARDAQKLAEKLLPDVILLDVSMPGGGITAARQIAASCPSVRIGMLTVSESDDDVIQSLQAGAHGYIQKGIGGTELVDVVKSLYVGDLYVSPGLAAQLLTESVSRGNVPKSIQNGVSAEADHLTSREEQILEGITQGLSNREIGQKLHISEKTVKNYVTNVLQKLHVRNRVEAAMLAQSRYES